MRIELHTAESIFDALADSWDSLLAPGRSDTLFLRNDWQRIWWKHLRNGTLAIVTVREDDGQLLGIAPWFIAEHDHKHSLHFIGCVDVTDYTDLIIRPGCEERVTGALLDFLMSPDAPAWDVMDLCNIPEGSPTLARLPALGSARGLKVTQQVQDVCPVVDLPGSYEEYLDSLDKKQRHELRRKRRRAEMQDVGWYTVSRQHNLDEEIDAFFDLMAMSTTAKAGFLKETGNRAFFREIGHALLENGMLELIFLTVGGQRAATMWQFAYQDRVLLYNSGFNSAEFGGLSPGIVLLTYSIEDAIQRGMKKYDFLRGDEEYKYRMGARDNAVYNVVIQRQDRA